MTDVIRFSPEVEAALREHQPVVALESTLITHGLPWPDNAATALAMEGAVRQGGAVPATIAVLGGCITVGLSREQIEDLARRPSRVSELSGGDSQRANRALLVHNARTAGLIARELTAFLASGLPGA